MVIGASFAFIKTAGRPTRSSQFMDNLPQSKRLLVLSSLFPSKTEAICSTKCIPKTLRITEYNSKQTNNLPTPHSTSCCEQNSPRTISTFSRASSVWPIKKEFGSGECFRFYMAFTQAEFSHVSHLTGYSKQVEMALANLSRLPSFSVARSGLNYVDIQQKVISNKTNFTHF